MATPAAQRDVPASRDRRKRVEARLGATGPRGALRRTPPPEGRLGADDYAMPRLREALIDLGPVFAAFGRYLSTRIDLLSRRDARELSAIPDRGTAMPASHVDACLLRQLGMPGDRRFFAFEPSPMSVTIWAQRHSAWVAPGVPVVVTIVRADAAAWIESDVPCLPLLHGFFELPAAVFDAAIDDFVLTLRRSLDQTHQAAAFAALAADASAGGGFDAPQVYRDHCAPGVLTVERPGRATLADVLTDAEGLRAEPFAGDEFARRVMSAWLRQTLSGRIVPFDFDARDIVVNGDRLMLTGGAFEAHASGERARFLTYLIAVAADDPESAAAWIVDASAPERVGRNEEELRRRLRQAVPFRDGEWSGDDRLAEHVLVQWRMAREAGWPLTPHHLRVYRGLYAATALASQLAPDDDALAGALLNERMQMGLADAKQMLDPRVAAATLDRLMQEMLQLPQKLDDVLTLAAEGRLRVRLTVPDGDAAHSTRNRTVLLVATLVALTALASVARHFAPALGLGAERLTAVAVLVLGGWLLIVAARM